jgi:hypothetical protein
MPDESGDLNPKEATGDNSEPSQHWFAGRDVDTLFYKVNRRPPITGETLFTQPPSVLDHLEEVLSFPVVVESGRRFRREWRIGNKEFNHQAGTLTGMIGWTRSGAALASAWDEDHRSWVDRIVPDDVSAVAPFAFTADGRFLGVLRHSSFSEKTLPTVFRDILNRGERARVAPTTDWDVEPVGDEQEFYDWVASTDRVLKVEFVFKRPNPDAEREFEALFARMDELEARQIRESIRALDNDRGLNKQALRSEPTSRMFIAAAMAAFGYVVGNGVSRGRRVRYDQRTHAAREHLENVSVTWDAATEEVLGAVRRLVVRRRRDE